MVPRQVWRPYNAVKEKQYNQNYSESSSEACPADRVWKGSYLENEAIPQDEAGDGIHHNEDQGQDEAPHNDDAPRLWQLHQLCDLKACEVIDSKQRQQHLQARMPQGFRSRVSGAPTQVLRSRCSI